LAKNKFNKAWLDRHLNDPYVKLAQKHGYRARAAFKLIEIDEQDKLIKPGMTIVDLGSAPGAWSQAIRERLRVKTKTEEGSATVVQGRIIALDILPMEPIADVEFILGDFREEMVMRELEARLQGQKVDLVFSDMAPNLSGVQVADAARMGHLVELAMAFCESHLKPEGSLLVKCFYGTGYSQLVQLFKQKFKQVAPRKPKASRPESAESFILGRRLKHQAKA
jgi:23S rRNA (uridine2552-2'-O)-methyltransferase